MEYRPLQKIQAIDQKDIESNTGTPRDINMKINDMNMQQKRVSVLIKHNVCRLQNFHEFSPKDEELNTEKEHRNKGIKEHETITGNTVLMQQFTKCHDVPTDKDCTTGLDQFHTLLANDKAIFLKGNIEYKHNLETVSPVCLSDLTNGSRSTTSSEADRSDCMSLDSLSDDFKKKVAIEKRQKEREKSIIKSAHISNEYVRLSELLDAMCPEQFLDEIKLKLNKKDSKAVVALSILLPRKHFPPVDHLHCVRCHRNFRPSENGRCIIKHPTAKVIKQKHDKQGADFKCMACETKFRLNQMFFYNEDVNSYLSGFCFSGKHTSNPQEVSYIGAAKTCEENGCVEFYV